MLSAKKRFITKTIPLSEKIKKETATQNIHFSHITENYLVNARKDPNCIFPINQLNFLESKGYVKSVANEILSCMGGIYSQRRVFKRASPSSIIRIQTSKGRHRTASSDVTSLSSNRVFDR